MNNTVDYKAFWEKGEAFDAYMKRIETLLEEGKTTGPVQTEALVEYTDLNAKRMARLMKTYTPSEALKERLQNKSNLAILIITEGWCGDAAQIVPVIAKAGSAAGVEVRTVLRDEHLDLMDAHLTNGGRSIPILLFIDQATWEVSATWGPRPEAAQELVMNYKKAAEPKPPYTEFVKEVQLWYAKDKQQSMEAEWIEILAD